MATYESVKKQLEAAERTLLQVKKGAAILREKRYKEHPELRLGWVPREAIRPEEKKAFPKMPMIPKMVPKLKPKFQEKMKELRIAKTRIKELKSYVRTKKFTLGKTFPTTGIIIEKKSGLTVKEMGKKLVMKKNAAQLLRLKLRKQLENILSTEATRKLLNKGWTKQEIKDWLKKQLR